MNKPTTNPPIKTFEDACKALSISETLPDVSNIPEEFSKSIIAFYKLCIIAKALNGEWIPDLLNSNQIKFYTYFYLDNGGVAGFAYRSSNIGLGLTYSHFVSRLCVKDRETAIFFGEQFEAIWKDYILG